MMKLITPTPNTQYYQICVRTEPLEINQRIEFSQEISWSVHFNAFTQKLQYIVHAREQSASQKTVAQQTSNQPGRQMLTQPVLTLNTPCCLFTISGMSSADMDKG